MHSVGSELCWGYDPGRAHSTALVTAYLQRRAMISDPKLPFASDPTSVGELKSPAQPSLPLAPVAISPTSSSVARLWLRRIGVLLFVFLCATLGVMLMILPWRPDWSDNPLLLSYPTLRAVVASGF